ncbi:ScbR family autoregulator-binding transcription factor [Rhodococcus aetherivorans]|uniref:ScbR family autoregulator-binding transcription factor n=1 Tax=Rhodococcus aetherivorans TaxID=191292 RepID=UPI0002D21DAF|nr:ScbR family autoregulator-binding transcription factor [Rhodococcus aetherivorans]CCW12469.1 putative transcriptional regulator [Rhodococcus aetherivorans]
MARQVRAEVTRDSVLRGAAEVFMNLGYANASLNEIIQQSGVTKGALYFHFASKEELARAVIDEGFARLGSAGLSAISDRTPALETMIELSVLTVDVSHADPIVRAMFRLVIEIGDYRGSGEGVFAIWLSTVQDLAKRALAEGDLSEELEPDAVGLLVLQALTGARAVAAALNRRDELVEHLENMWRLLVPALVPADKVEYFRQFVSRRLRV